MSVLTAGLAMTFAFSGRGPVRFGAKILLVGLGGFSWSFRFQMEEKAPPVRRGQVVFGSAGLYAAGCPIQLEVFEGFAEPC